MQTFKIKLIEVHFYLTLGRAKYSKLEGISICSKFKTVLFKFFSLRLGFVIDFGPRAAAPIHRYR